MGKKTVGEKHKQHIEEMLSGEAVYLPVRTTPLHSVNFPREGVVKFTYTNREPNFHFKEK